MPIAAIKVEGLGKQYLLGARARYGSLRDSVMKVLQTPLGSLAGDADPRPTLWALKGVSFDVAEGEIVGIIGRNGSGKSTLLKILSRITEPTEGHAEVRGRVSSLLEVGTGFHPELSGRENVFINGAILGMGRREIARKFDEIVAFAEIDRFIDTPVKHYSSGMQMRLAFAVAAHLEPSILLVDEVLAVGDAAFQRKCLGKMGDVARNGRTVLYVSHDLTSVQVLCQRAVRLAHGRVQGIGPVSEQINQYLAEVRQIAPTDWDHPMPLGSNFTLVRFGFTPNPVPSGEPVTFELELQVERAVRFDEVAAFLHTNLGRLVSVIDLRPRTGFHQASKGQNLRLRAELSSLPLVEGEYVVGASIRSGDDHQLPYELMTLDVTPSLTAGNVGYRPEIRGLVAFDYKVRVVEPEPDPAHCG